MVFDQRAEQVVINGETVTRLRMYITLAPEARHVRRVLGPTAWTILEDLAGGGVMDNLGRLIAPTTARHVARRIGVTAETVRKYLRVLMRYGLVSVEANDGRYPPEFPQVYVVNPRSSLDALFEPE